MATTEVTNAVHIASASVRSSATSVVRSIDIAGVLEIAQVIGTATSTSNGTRSTPTSSLHVGEVTVDGVPAYIDASGVHVDGKSPPVDGVTPSQAQQTLDHTFAQDGLSVRVLEPTTTTTAAGMATGDSGGIEVTESHAFAVPVVPGAPSIPIPGLGDESLPAGTYQAVTTVTLGEAVAGVEASAVPPAFGLGMLSSVGALPIASSAASSTGAGLSGGGSVTGTGSGLGFSAAAGNGLGFSAAAGNGLGFSTAPSPASESTAASGLGAGLLPPSGSRSALAAGSGPFGIPVPFGWAVAALTVQSRSSSTPWTGIGPATGSSSPLDEVLIETAMAGDPHTGSTHEATHASLAQPELVATATGSLYHLADCPIVATHGKDLRLVSAAEAATMHPCRLCSPPSVLGSARSSRHPAP